MFCDTNESESCLVNAPAKHASESVNCCVQACKQTQRHTRKETREMCSCWGYKQQSSSRKSGEWRDSNFQQSSRLAKSGKLEKTLEISSHVERPRNASDPSSSSDSRCIAERAISILVPKSVDFKRTHDDTGDRLSRVQTTQRSPLALSRICIKLGYRQSFCVEESRIIVGTQQLDRIMSVLKFCHIEQISAWIDWSVWSLVHVHPR